jgi:drug/metabolite transporter (DMT)-like permease
MAFFLAFFIGLLYLRMRGSSLKALLPHPLSVWVLGIGGLFGYHLLYFIAFRLAPPVEVNLLNYLWPLLIVVLSAFLPGERLRWWHIVGTTLALLGTVILITGGEKISIDLEYIPGYAAALGAAVVWATYSVMSRKFKHIPTEMVTGYCGITAILALISHLLLESTVAPQGTDWLIILAIGIGPVGSAFYLWDHGIKRGDIRVLGVGSYVIPLLSTGLLVLFGPAVSTWKLWVSCALIVAGAVLAGWEVLRGKEKRED